MSHVPWGARHLAGCDRLRALDEWRQFFLLGQSQHWRFPGRLCFALLAFVRLCQAWGTCTCLFLTAPSGRGVVPAMSSLLHMTSGEFLAPEKKQNIDPIGALAQCENTNASNFFPNFSGILLKVLGSFAQGLHQEAFILPGEDFQLEIRNFCR
ncbi:hypothetical protein B0H19DRAFT_1183355 [Mycena capillaripes]|nr:hypothetical protein B0H19DRAFT_1183355 [Mycena capillaripes]